MSIENLLVPWLPHQRWFGAKGREIAGARVHTAGTLVEGDPEVEVHLVTTEFADGGNETYQVPLEYRSAATESLGHVLLGELNVPSGARYVHDALHDKEVTGAWLRHIAAGDSVGDLRFHREPGAPEFPLDEPSIVMTAEQSNTSLVYGREVILKVFRKVSPGLNPDIEIHSALHRAGSTHIATPLGWVEGRWPTPKGEVVDGSLAMLQQFLPTASEGWAMATTSVRDLFAEGDLHADEVGGDFAGEAERLGVATAEVHADLADTLPTGTLSPEGLAETAEAMRRRLEEATRAVPALAEHAAPIRSTFDELGRSTTPLPAQRVHGDYHLGQVLRTETGWVLLDFEGEPARPLAERRLLESPLRDVAGMLRSFDYAARHLLVTDYGHEAQLEYRASEWAHRNRNAFCEGYAKVAGSDPREHDTALRAFELDKVVYEAVYETRHRPGWLPIPMAAVERLTADAGRVAGSSGPRPHG